MNIYPSPSSGHKKILYIHMLQLNLCPLSKAVPSCGWTLNLVHSRPLQLISASVIILLGQITHTLSHLDNVQLSGPMKNLSHQTAMHTKLSRPCQSTRVAPIATHYDKPSEVHPQSWQPSTQHIVVNRALRQSTETPNLPHHQATIVHNSSSKRYAPCLKPETI
jgi:hypothetical protein